MNMKYQEPKEVYTIVLRFTPTEIQKVNAYFARHPELQRLKTKTITQFVLDAVAEEGCGEQA